MKKVLITGGLGFIGSHLVKKYVDNGDDVTVITRNMIKEYNVRSLKDSIKIVKKDIRDIGEEDVKGMDLIFHCASTVDNYNIWDDPYVDAEVNVMGTISLLEACRNFNKDAIIIYTSTFFVNGNPSVLPVTENLKEEPLGLYGATKLCAEHCIKTYMRVFGLKAKIVRLSNVFGLGEQCYNNKKAAFNRMIYKLTRDEQIDLYDNGKVRRDYIYIDDVIDAMFIIAEKGKNALEQVYYISRGESVSFRQLVDWIIEVTGNNKVNVVNSPDFHKNVGIDDFVCDINPLKELGWTPKVLLKDGIKKVYDQYFMELING